MPKFDRYREEMMIFWFAVFTVAGCWMIARPRDLLRLLKSEDSEINPENRVGQWLARVLGAFFLVVAARGIWDKYVN